MRCEAMVAERDYSRPGRCQIKNNVKPIYIKEGHERVRVRFCTPHRKMAEGNRSPAIAR